MRIWFVASLVLAYLFFVVQGVKADTPTVVLRGMSAVPDAGSEWIAIENTSSASTAAQIWSVRDVQGSVKTFLIPGLSAYELKMFLGTETKISLNNTGDQLELLHGNVVVQASAPYEELVPGNLWVLLSDGWQEITPDEWDRRWSTRDWLISTPSPFPSAAVQSTPLPSVSPTPSIIATSSALITPLENKKVGEWWQNVAFPHEKSLATTSAVFSSEPPIWEREPGDFTGELQVFMAWKRKIGVWLALVFSCSVFSLALSAPRLYRCYNDVCLFDDG